MSLYDLLPPNSTQLERDLSRAVSSIPRLAGSIPIIRTAKRKNYPASVLPWLLYEYGLGEISDYLPDYQAVLEQGLAWQRIRGTPRSIIDAVGWIGYTATLDEDEERQSERWPDYHLTLDGLPAEADLYDIAYLATISTPVRGTLQRIYFDWDLRRQVLDETYLDGPFLLDDHSGIRDVIDGFPDVQVSLGDYRIESNAGPDADAAHQWALYRGSNDERELFLLDEWSDLDEWWHVLNSPSTRTDEYIEWSSEESGGWPATPWPALSWVAMTGGAAEGFYYEEV